MNWRALLDSQISRYLQSGLVVFGLDLGLFSLLTWMMPAHYALWTVAGRLAGAATGFVLHNGYSFAGEKSASLPRMALRYGLVLACNAALSVLLLRLAVEGLHFATWLARPAIDVFVIALAFVLSRHWVFRKAPQP